MPDAYHSLITDYIINQMSHFMLSQGKFVFAIFACDHEFLASDDASSLRELRLPKTWRTLTSTRVHTENVKM